MMMAAMFFRLGWRRISTLARRWVMSRQATFMAALGWGKSERCAWKKPIEHTCFCQTDADAVIVPIRLGERLLMRFAVRLMGDIDESSRRAGDVPARAVITTWVIVAFWSATAR